jgi:hypothetical protein
MWNIFRRDGKCLYDVMARKYSTVAAKPSGGIPLLTLILGRITEHEVQQLFG